MALIASNIELCSSMMIEASNKLLMMIYTATILQHATSDMQGINNRFYMQNNTCTRRIPSSRKTPINMVTYQAISTISCTYII